MAVRLFGLEKSLGPLQRRVMDVVWELGEAKVSDVKVGLRGDKQLAYTTIMTVLDGLHKRGYLLRRRVGRAFVYQPRYERMELGEKSLRKTLYDLWRRHGAVKMIVTTIRVGLVGDSSWLDVRQKLATSVKFRWSVVYGMLGTLMGLVAMLALIDLVGNVNYFGTVEYVKLAVTQPELFGERMDWFMVAIWESLPLVNLAITVMALGALYWWWKWRPEGLKRHNNQQLRWGV